MEYRSLYMLVDTGEFPQRRGIPRRKRCGSTEKLPTTPWTKHLSNEEVLRNMETELLYLESERVQFF